MIRLHVGMTAPMLSGEWTGRGHRPRSSGQKAL